MSHDDLTSAAQQPLSAGNDAPSSMPSVAQTAARLSPVREPRDSRGMGAGSLRARSAAPVDTRPKFKLGQPTATGYKFGPSRFVAASSIPETQRAIAVPGESFAATGYEALDAKGVFVSWHDCPVDAMSVLKPDSFREGKVVRCVDRVLLKTKRPGRGRL